MKKEVKKQNKNRTQSHVFVHELYVFFIHFVFAKYKVHPGEKERVSDPHSNLYLSAKIDTKPVQWLLSVYLYQPMQ